MIIYDKPEAPKDADLGMYAFPAWRHNMPHEPDTEVEDRLMHQIKDHLINSKQIKPEMEAVLKKIVANGWYSSLINSAKPGTKIYRGMRVDENWLTSAVNDRFTESKRFGSYDGPMTFTPRDGKYSTSWTTKEDVALEFTSRRGSLVYAIVLHSIVADNMFTIDCTNFYFQMDRFSSYRSEYEIICFGPVKCTKIEWFRNGNFG